MRGIIFPSLCVAIIWVLIACSSPPHPKMGKVKPGTVGTEVAVRAATVSSSEMNEYMNKQESELKDSASLLTDKKKASIYRTNSRTIAITIQSDAIFNDLLMNQTGFRLLEKFAKVFKEYPATSIRVEGYYSQGAVEQKNIIFSEAIADSIKSNIITFGIEAGRMVTIGMGTLDPISTEEAQNRRVRIIITGNQQPDIKF